MKVIISSCLLGNNVRYDGGNCLVKNPWLEDLDKRGLLAPLCPEMQAGLGCPRPPIELRQGRIFDESGQDLTALFDPVLKDLKNFLKAQNVAMAVLKEKSPSCGVNFVYDGSFSGKTVSGRGLIAEFLSGFVPVFSENELDRARELWLRLDK